MYGDEERTNRWVSRGKGQLKILRDKTTNKVRLLHRQEKTYKVRLNLPLTGAEKDPTVHSEKSRMFIGVDFSDEEDGKMWTFSVQFRNKKIADEFVETFKKARDGDSTSIAETNDEVPSKVEDTKNSNDDDGNTGGFGDTSAKSVKSKLSAGAAEFIPSSFTGFMPSSFTSQVEEDSSEKIKTMEVRKMKSRLCGFE